MKRTPPDTRAEMSFIAMPEHLNALDSVFGGQVMAWIDVAAGISAQRFARTTVVTASMDHLTFKAPIRKGDITVLQAQVNWAGRTSMEVGVRVEVEDRRTGVRTHTSTAYLTMVALDDDGRPTHVPELHCTHEVERRRFEDAKDRRQIRLEQRERAKQRGRS